MKIATFNTWGNYGPPERKPVLAQAIRNLDADLVCLQEVVDPACLEPFSYPVRLHASAGNLALLSRFPLVSHREITYRAVSPLETVARQALLVELSVNGRPFWAVTTHLSWKETDETTRLAQTEELLQAVEPLGGRVLLSGDFNAEPAHAPMDRIRQAGFVDLFARRHPKEPGWTWDNQNPFIQSHSVRFPDRRIDYLFLRQEALTEFNVLDCKVVCQAPSPEGTRASDHYGVLATLEISGAQ